MSSRADLFSTRATIATAAGPVDIFSLPKYAAANTKLEQLPFSIRVLLENLLRNCDGRVVTRESVAALAAWSPTMKDPAEIPFQPARVVLQDFTGVPCVVDLAAMRNAMAKLGGDPAKINPIVPVDLVIDHSVQVDAFGSDGALRINSDFEFSRNHERYQFLRWGQQAFQNLRIVPPATGIVHQVNLEYLARCVWTKEEAGATLAFPDTLVGTDSHTTMINGLGVVGWGVGGIEAEACMLGQPIYMLIPEVVGFRLTGKMPAGATATDLVLTVTQMLRSKGVVGKFVEFFGPGLSAMTLPDRATIANMAPEYGATVGFFPVDDETLRYMRLTGRPEELVQLVETYYKAQGLFRADSTPDPMYTDTLSLDLGTVEPCLAGPKRPQDRVTLGAMKSTFSTSLRQPVEKRGFGLGEEKLAATADVRVNGHAEPIGHGAVVIAAITSCTNTSNPSVMIGAGLLAQKAAARGLRVKPWVKTSLAPGSRVVTSYLDRAGLTEPLAQLGFQTVGYGCTTCIGNSGPLPEAVAKAIGDGGLVAAAVLSGNRNFEGRVHPLVKANYLASPPLVVAYALAGTVDLDLATEPLGVDAGGKPVYLKEIWPTPAEIAAAEASSIDPSVFHERYGNVFTGNERWNAIAVGGGQIYDWDAASTYIQEPPFFTNLTLEPAPTPALTGLRVLAKLGDSVTTDHISPAGSIKADSPAGKHLQEHGVKPSDFNSYGSRRGNDRVMTRGTFANIRLRNQLLPGSEGGVTVNLETGATGPIFDVAEFYKSKSIGAIILAGAEYGSGSSRDWAAKGAMLLGVRAVMAASFERIHRSNLVGMGVLPLQFEPGQTHESLGLTGRESYDVLGFDGDFTPGQSLTVVATDESGGRKTITVRCRIDTPVEVDYYRHGGILPYVLRGFLKHGAT